MLNAPRDIPYEFAVFERGGIVYLVDLSERTYPCTATPHYYCEPLYDTDHGDEDLGGPAYFLTSDIDGIGTIHVPMDEGNIVVGVLRTVAWATAREEATGNCLI
jgi:hypothetical protein